MAKMKKTWNFKDYPVETFKNRNAQVDEVMYGAKITNWFAMVGHGSSPKSALEALESKFDMYCERNEEIPAPGENVPIRYASTVEIDKQERMAVDLFKKVFNADYYDGFYSDESYFGIIELQIQDDVEDGKQYIIDAIKKNYGLDVSDIYDLPLWQVLKVISEKN